jgi:hypothetical protein
MQHAWKGRTMHSVSIGKSGGNRLLVIPRHRWEENIIMDLRETGWGKGLEPSNLG